MNFSVYYCSPERVVFAESIGSILIEDCRISVKPVSGDPFALEIDAVTSIRNLSSELNDTDSLRLWIEGKNSLGEPVEMVLVEHLFIPEETSKEVSMSGILFHPVLKSECYKFRLEYLDHNDHLLWSSQSFKFFILNK